MLGRIFLVVFILSAFIFAYMKYFERNSIYYPEKDVIFTPADNGMEYENIYFMTVDGVQLNGWFVPQKNPRGTLLFCHGNAGNIGHRVEIIELFRKLNLNVFIFDYRGYGKSQGAPSEQGLYKDAFAAYKYLLSRNGIDRRSIVIYGKSIGANVAADLAAKVNAAAFISDSGFTSAYEMGRKLFPCLPVKWIITVQYDALSKMDAISMPKLIIHSKNDEIVPFKMGLKLYESAAPPKEFYQMGGTHNEAILIERQEYIARIDSFLDKYLSPL
ncbi:alpha/beta hydrolase [Candidatus Omnitrophota bacterium]